jgi:hypothetical protein
MQTADMLDVIGAVASQLKQYAISLPPVVHRSIVPSGVKPTLEAIDAYEECVSRVRAQSAGTRYRNLNDALIESLEAFEAGRLLGAVQPLLALLDQLDRMNQDKEIEVGRLDEKRIGEYRTMLHKILPGNKPELDGSGQGL